MKDSIMIWQSGLELMEDGTIDTVVASSSELEEEVSEYIKHIDIPDSGEDSISSSYMNLAAAAPDNNFCSGVWSICLGKKGSLVEQSELTEACAASVMV